MSATEQDGPLPRKLIIDADPGIGDAVAVLLAMLDPDLDVVAVTATGGCVTADFATRNLQSLVERLDPPKRPRLGASSPLLRVSESLSDDDLEELRQLNGREGLGDWTYPVADLHHRHESAKLMTDLVRAEPNEITLLTLGPLTNVEAACDRAPEFLGQLGGLVCLGGAMACGGDVTAAAEFNIFADPQAARAVLSAPATKTLVPLDVTRRVVLTFEHYQQVPTPADSALGNLLNALLPYAFRAHHQFLGVEGVPLHALTALAVLTRPKLFQTELMAVDVETQGEITRGSTVFDRRGIPRWQTNIEVVTDVNVAGVIDYFQEIVRRNG